MAGECRSWSPYFGHLFSRLTYPRLSSDPFKKQQRITLKADRVLKPISGPPSLI